MHCNKITITNNLLIPTIVTKYRRLFVRRTIIFVDAVTTVSEILIETIVIGVGGCWWNTCLPFVQEDTRLTPPPVFMPVHQRLSLRLPVVT